MVLYSRQRIVLGILVGMFNIPAFSGTGLPNKLLPLSSNWFDRVNISGSISIGGFASNHTPTTIGVIPSNMGNSPRATDIAITYASLGANSQLTDWMSTTLNFAYQQAAPSFIRSPVGGGNVVLLDTAYITFANTDCTPAYIKVGRYFVSFGGLDNTSNLESTTQLLSLMRQTIVSAGIANWHGIYASAYIFRGLNQIRYLNTTQARTFGGTFGYEYGNKAVQYNLGMGYINNLVSALYTNSTVANGSPLNGNNYTKAVPGLDLHAIGNWHAADASIRYIASLSAFDVTDLPYTTNGGATFKGAKPVAWGVNGGYKFDVKSYSTRLGLGYQGSSEAVALGKASGSATNATAGVYGTSFAIGMPKIRFYTNYAITLNKWVNLAFELAQDRGYGTSNGGTGRSAITGIMMLTAKYV